MDNKGILGLFALVACIGGVVWLTRYKPRYKIGDEGYVFYLDRWIGFTITDIYAAEGQTWYTVQTDEGWSMEYETRLFDELPYSSVPVS